MRKRMRYWAELAAKIGAAPGRAVSARSVRRLGVPFHEMTTGERHTKPARRCWLIHEWGRDCDMYEADRVYAIPASRRELISRYTAVSREAEGPFTLRVITARDVEAFQPSIHDRVLEAYEDGRATAVVL